jgi:hypothetical protein
LMDLSLPVSYFSVCNISNCDIYDLTDTYFKMNTQQLAAWVRRRRFTEALGFTRGQQYFPFAIIQVKYILNLPQLNPCIIPARPSHPVKASSSGAKTAASPF